MTPSIDVRAFGPSRLDTADLRPPAVRMRASDADRHATVEILQDAIARGLLTPAEGSDRMAVAFAAVHQVELAPLTVDLPAAPEAAPTSGPRASVIEQIRSALVNGGERTRVAQVAAGLVLLLLLLTLGTAMLHVLLDGGGGPGRGGMGGFGHR